MMKVVVRTCFWLFVGLVYLLIVSDFHDSGSRLGGGIGLVAAKEKGLEYALLAYLLSQGGGGKMDGKKKVTHIPIPYPVPVHMGGGGKEVHIFTIPKHHHHHKQDTIHVPVPYPIPMKEKHDDDHDSHAASKTRHYWITPVDTTGLMG